MNGRTLSMHGVPRWTPLSRWTPLVLLLVTMFPLATPLTCPPAWDSPCDCRVLGITAVKAVELDCRRRNLTQVPDFSELKGKPVYQVDLSENYITYLQDESFTALEFVKLPMYPYPRIDISYNPVKSIASGAFRHIRAEEISLVMMNSTLRAFPDLSKGGLLNLTFLHFMDNHLSALPEFYFKPFPKLSAINLSGNKIQYFSRTAFMGLEHTLEVLYLNDMNLSDFPSEALQPLHRLRRLELDNNRITNLPPRLFRGFRTTTSAFSLSIQNNLINFIAENAFHKAYFSLYDLNLNTNKLTDLAFLSDPCSLAFRGDGHIDVQGNPINCTCDVYNVIRTGYYNVHGKCRHPNRYRGVSFDTSNGYIPKAYKAIAYKDCDRNQTTYSILCTLPDPVQSNVSASNAAQQLCASFLLVFLCKLLSRLQHPRPH